jgi:lipopolysaccharide export system permease protein
VPRVLSFTGHDLPIDLPKIEAFRSRGGKDRERTMPELVQIGNDPRLPKLLRDESIANFHFRLVEVAMMLLLPFLAIALAVPPKRSSSALGVFLSIVMVVAYHKINEYAESMGSLGKIDPFLALWVPFLLFAALILKMYYTLAHVPGGQPIAVLENLFARIGPLFRRLAVKLRLISAEV